MRYGIFSDIHANLEALEAVLLAYNGEKIDQYLCAGDVVGYAADPKACIDKVKALAQVTVAGNHDWASIDLFPADDFNPVAKKAMVWTKQNLDQDCRYFLEGLKLSFCNQDLTLVHGTLDHPEEFHYLMDEYSAGQTFELLENNICFLGHSHMPGIFIKKEEGNMYYSEDNYAKIQSRNKYIINVGSIGQPRDNDPRAAYCIYDTDTKEVWIKRISYDLEAAKNKIIAIGLPRFLAERLRLGQ